MKNRQLYLVVIGVLLLGGAVWADDDDSHGRGNGKGPDDNNGQADNISGQTDNRILEFRLVQAGAFNPTSVLGSSANPDQLTGDAKDNRLSVQHGRTVQVEFRPVAVQPAGTRAGYSLWLCRFGALALPVSANSGCVALLDSQTKPVVGLTADSNGVVRGTAVIPQPSQPQNVDVWVGSFVITRDVQGTADVPQFISAIDFQPAPNGAAYGNVNGSEAEVRGAIGKVEGDSFWLVAFPDLKVTTDASTRFDGRPNSIHDLEAGMTVDVKGVVQTDTAKNRVLLAERVRAEHEQ